MSRIALITALLLAGAATAGTFNPTPYLAESQIDVLNRQVTNQTVDRDLFSAPYATVVVGNVDVYENFPYLEARYFQVVSDPGWDRLVFGEMDKGLQSFDGRGSSFGPLKNPRGMDSDDRGRVYVADAGNNRVLVFETVTEFERMTLVPLFAIDDLNQPYDVAFSDGGSAFDATDDVLYVANTGQNEVRRYRLQDDAATLTARLGELGSGANSFAGPLALTVARSAGSHTADVYVADAHNERLVQLRDQDGQLNWVGERKHELGAVTSLSSDHWGNLYAASVEGGLVKYTSGLKAVAGAMTATARPRAFHVPHVTTTDHRTNTRRRSGEGHGILVEEWNDGSGLRVMNLGVEIKNPALSTDGETAVDLFLTDEAQVSTELRDPRTGELVSIHRAGQYAAGAQRVPLQAADADAGWDAGQYVLKVRAESTYDAETVDEVELTVNLARSGDPSLPARLTLLGNTPNPFNPSTTIKFAVPAGTHTDHSLNVYDPRGRLVRQLASGPVTPGSHAVVWDGRNSAGDPVGSGVYLYRVVVGQQKTTGKMTLLK